MEMEASRFYSRAASRTSDVTMRELLNMLADEERKHTRAASEYEERHLTEKAKSEEEESHKKLPEAIMMRRGKTTGKRFPQPCCWVGTFVL